MTPSLHGLSMAKINGVWPLTTETSPGISSSTYETSRPQHQIRGNPRCVVETSSDRGSPRVTGLFEVVNGVVFARFFGEVMLHPQEIEKMEHLKMDICKRNFRTWIS